MFHIYFSFNKKMPWIISQPRFCTCTWMATRSLVRKVSRKLLDGISCAEDEDGRIWEWEVHLELQHVYTCHWGGEIDLVILGLWPSSYREALQNSKAMSSRPLQTTPQRLLRIQLIPMVKPMPKTLACMFNNKNSPRTMRRLLCNWLLWVTQTILLHLTFY